MSTANMLVKSLVPEETNFTPGEPSDVSYITCEVVDHDLDVVIASGVDYQSVFMKNPVVLANHDMRKWPVGMCAWIKSQKSAARGKMPGFAGLIAKTIYDMEDADSAKLFRLIKGQIVRGKSITFTTPDDMKPGEWGPPTHEELKAHPEWEKAKQIIRRCKMIEYSVVTVPANQEALVIAVSKGLELPSYLQSLSPPDAGKVQVSMSTKAKPDPESVEDNQGTDKPKDKPEPPQFKAGHYVEYGKGMSAGCGKIMSIHKGKVPGVDDDVEGSEESPAAKVKVYKEDQATGKFRPTDKHVGKMCKDLSKVAHPLDDDEAETEEKAIILPPHRTLAQIKADAEAKAKAVFAASVATSKAAEDAADRALGIV